MYTHHTCTPVSALPNMPRIAQDKDKYVASHSMCAHFPTEAHMYV